MRIAGDCGRVLDLAGRLDSPRRKRGRAEKGTGVFFSEGVRRTLRNTPVPFSIRPLFHPREARWGCAPTHGFVLCERGSALELRLQGLRERCLQRGDGREPITGLTFSPAHWLIRFLEGGWKL